MDNGSLAELINPNDFVSLRHKLVVYNLTSGTELLVPDLFKLSYITSTHLSFQAPHKIAAVGHQLEILIFSDQVERGQYTRLTLASEKELLVVKGRIEAVHDVGLEGIVDFVLRLESYDTKQYALFVSAYRERQERLDKILDKCKE